MALFSAEKITSFYAWCRITPSTDHKPLMAIFLPKEAGSSFPCSGDNAALGTIMLLLWWAP